MNDKILPISAARNEGLLNHRCHPALDNNRGARMIDWTRVRELCDEVGAEDFDEIVDLFFDEVEEVTDRLRITPHLDALEGDLHFLKGSALSLGFSDFAKLCQHGETASGKGNAEDVDVAIILTAYDASKEMFLNERATVLAT